MTLHPIEYFDVGRGIDAWVLIFNVRRCYLWWFLGLISSSLKLFGLFQCASDNFHWHHLLFIEHYALTWCNCLLSSSPETWSRHDVASTRRWSPNVYDAFIWFNWVCSALATYRAFTKGCHCLLSFECRISTSITIAMGASWFSKGFAVYRWRDASVAWSVNSWSTIRGTLLIYILRVCTWRLTLMREIESCLTSWYVSILGSLWGNRVLLLQTIDRSDICPCTSAISTLSTHAFAGVRVALILTSFIRTCTWAILITNTCSLSKKLTWGLLSSCVVMMRVHRLCPFLVQCNLFPLQSRDQVLHFRFQRSWQ